MNMEQNKIFAALLVASLLAMGAGFISKAMVSPEPVKEHAYPIEGVASESTTSSATKTVKKTYDGAKVFAKCKACHTVDKGGKNRIGPNLHNIVGAPKAKVSGFAYSSAMQKFGGTWSEDELDKYLANPRKYIPGNKMTFVGLKTPEERKAIIQWLKKQK